VAGDHGLAVRTSSFGWSAQSAECHPADSALMDAVPLPSKATGQVRVAIVTNIPAPYRLPVYDLLSRETDIELRVIFCSGREPDRQWDLTETVTQHVFLRERYATWRGRYIHFNPHVWRVLSRVRPDVVVTTGFNPTHLIAWLYARWRGAAHVACTDGTSFSEMKLSRLHRMVRRIVYRSSSAFVAASDGGMELYRAYGLDDRRIFRSPLCAHNSSFAPMSDVAKSYDLLFCGRFVPVKNPVFAIEVARATAERIGRRVSIVFVGSGPEEPRMRAAAALASEHVDAIFAGFARQSELPRFYRSARIFLFPTSWDPWGVVANEACAAGLPVLVTPFAGASNELIRDGESGHVLPLDVEAWSAAAARLLSDPALLVRMGERARQSVQPYTYGNSAAGLAAAIRSARNLRQHTGRELDAAH